MAQFKIAKLKDKKYAFEAFENDKQKQPAICVFKRFPAIDEMFFVGKKESILDNVKIDAEALQKNKSVELQKILEQVVKVFLDNISAERIDYETFVKECVDHFENFNVAETGEKIETVNEFLALPPEAVYIIARDCYEYACKRDEFSMGE